MDKYAVIVAGGSGQRMNSSVPKQFLLLQGRPILAHTLERFLQSYADMQVVLVHPAAYVPDIDTLVAAADRGRVLLVPGGPTRFHSVQNGLARVPDDAMVFVHDAVRCLVPVELIRTCYEEARRQGSAIPALTATDSIRLMETEGSYPIDRNRVRMVQTPQTFPAAVLKNAFKQDYQESFTDEATVVEAAGVTVHLVEGDYRNIKITRPVDLKIAETVLQCES